MSEQKVLSSFIDMMAAYEPRKRDLNEFIYNMCGGVVASGIFKGIRLAKEEDMFGDIGPMILGCYEEELHPSLLEFASIPYQVAVLIGTGMGYYTVGLSGIAKCEKIISYEMGDERREKQGVNLGLNSGSVPVTLRGEAGQATLQADIDPAKRSFILCDCEGAEGRVLEPPTEGFYDLCDMIIETHDFFTPGVAQQLVDRFSGSHDVQVVSEGARNPNRFDFLRRATSLDRWVAVCENRPSTMFWLVLRAKKPRAGVEGL